MRRLYAEWEKQSLVLMAFPHENTDWFDGTPHSMQHTLSVFVRIAQAIAYGEPLYIICQNKEEIQSLFCNTHNITFIELPTNDTWIRDYGYVSIQENSDLKLLDFTFDGWGEKFDATLDNAINKRLHQKGYMGITPMESIDFVLEGGSIESDGEGTILTTTSCLCNPNRNGGLSQVEVEKALKTHLGASRILWLNHGTLQGDDTDGHIDTLARFLDKNTIAYLRCEDREDPHYQELLSMERELKRFCNAQGDPYHLIPLPLPKPIYNNQNQRLPATYLNFLITNKALIYPTYNDPLDHKVHQIFDAFFVTREIIPVDCRILIEQGGSLHCSTMQVHAP
jgi:agmatine deiminase